ncbi:hypothetical protein CTI12_AA010690 [Artemisia annua]|uniref:DUF1977 domain-containing protein n=1 Tax=Artemisia annua TaxID=35608 RepID=A0A2U1QMK1_ARTAN|nr:hypothetical protein CTI12_AA010690 [Artemisia annua]
MYLAFIALMKKAAPTKAPIAMPMGKAYGGIFPIKPPKDIRHASIPTAKQKKLILAFPLSSHHAVTGDKYPKIDTLEKRNIRRSLSFTFIYDVSFDLFLIMIVRHYFSVMRRFFIFQFMFNHNDISTLFLSDDELPKMTTEYRIEFYVESSNEFDEKYPLGSRARADIENTITKDYICMLRHDCYYEQRRRSQRRDFPTPQCDKLQSLGMHEQG